MLCSSCLLCAVALSVHVLTILAALSIKQSLFSAIGEEIKMFLQARGS